MTAPIKPAYRFRAVPSFSRWAFLSFVAAGALSVGCGPAKVQLWSGQWARYHVGSTWEHGVTPSDGQRFEVKGRNYTFRAHAINSASNEGQVRIDGAGGSRAWRLPPGAAEDLDWTVPSAGWYAVSVSPGLVLGEPRLVRPRRNAPLVVLLLADTLRGDHVNETLTPRLLAAFRGGERFTDATSNASWTLPSVASLFTSRPTIELTAVDGGLVAIPEGVTSWAEALRARGFCGGAVVANFTVNVPNDFGKGFDTFVVPAKYGPKGHPEAAQVLGQARSWLRAHRGEPAFLYLQFMDQHEPYHDHEGNMPAMAPIEPLASRAREASPEETRQRKDAYAATVRYLDRQLGPFLAELPPQAVVAFTADHGEAFGEHGAWGHGLNLYREALHVPLLVRGPGVPAKVERGPVQLLDLIPTLLDLEGCPLPAGMVGRTLLRGGSSEPAVAVTFGAGPLRWLWRDGTHVVLVHTRPQPGLAPEAEVKMQEERPLPIGVFRFDLERDPNEEHPEPPDPATLTAAARVFAISVGRLVPGLQVMSVGQRGPAVVSFRTPEAVHVAQAFSTTATQVTLSGDRVEVRWDDAPPFGLVAFSAGSPVRPAQVAGTPWRWFGDTGDVRIDGPGAFLWWNQRNASLQRGYEETLKRLRSLGYIP
ncbi:MAG: sulfatase [Thermoanaerobaculaceae bacterium]|nr:sulfatase [Thermoanaerobaculaceae bacterium]